MLLLYILAVFIIVVKCFLYSEGLE